MENLSKSDNNKRIAKNTLLLYFRMFITMAVTLYTSRIVLNVLGVEDFGIYNIVAGVIVLLSFMTSSLTQATQRFLSFELGRNDLAQFSRVFSTSLIIYLLFSAFIVLVGELLGPYIVNNFLNIPMERREAAIGVYHFSVVTFVFTVLRTPYNAAIIAYERMTFYAYVSIIEVVLKLGIVYLLLFKMMDNLKLYAALVGMVAFFLFVCYFIYCNRNYHECVFQKVWDIDLFKKLLGFSGWSMFGSLAVITSTQGLNIIINLLFGVVVNAAMGVTNQVSNAVNQFAVNFQTAFNPQITKLYAIGDKESLSALIYQTSQFSFYLLFVICIPLIVNINFVLDVWLKNVPEYSDVFIRYMLFSLLIDSLSAPLWMSVQAVGRIKKYQIVVSSIFILGTLATYFSLLWLPYPAIAMIIKCMISIILLLVRIFLISELRIISFKEFLKRVLLKCGILLGGGYALTAMLLYCIRPFFSSIIQLLFTILLTLILVLYIGLDIKEREKCYRFVKFKLKKYASTHK